MPPSTAAPAVKPHRTRRSTRIVRIGAGALAATCVLAVLCIRFWPFGEKPVIQGLQEASDSGVRVRNFHETYFPYPGCILEGVTFSRAPDGVKPLITIDRLTIRSTYIGVLRLHVSRITVEGMHIVIPPFGTAEPLQTKRSTIAIDEIVANGAIVEFESRDPDKAPLRFDIHEATLRDVSWSSPLTYRVKVRNPEPPGEISATGKFGVWNEDDPAETPVSGEYKLDHADLSVFRGIAGTLSSSGKFDGKLGHIDIAGTTNTPDFEVTSGGHPVPLTAEFIAYVDATHGDTFLKRVDANFRKTHIIASGSVAESANGKGKTALVDLSANGGRIEDLVGLFVKKEPAPMSGPVTLRVTVRIPSGDRPFLEKIGLRGAFGIGGGEFSQASTQEGINKLSAGARGEKDTSDPETVLTDLTGQVVVENGRAKFPELSFGVPGATARMKGSFGLVDYKMDLRGQLWVDTKLSNTTSGAKAVLLKMMDPLFKKRNKGEVLPVRISGTYQKPSFGLDLADKKAERMAPPSPTPDPRLPANLPKSHKQ
jgi:AsmA-like C-terminal region